MFAVGCGPLLAFGLFVALGLNKDPNPNPVGLGMMAFFTFYPSLGLILIGLATSIARHRSARKRFNDHVA